MGEQNTHPLRPSIKIRWFDDAMQKEAPISLHNIVEMVMAKGEFIQPLGLVIANLADTANIIKAVVKQIAVLFLIMYFSHLCMEHSFPQMKWRLIRPVQGIMLPP